MKSFLRIFLFLLVTGYASATTANDDVFGIRKLDNDKLLKLYWNCTDVSDKAMKGNLAIDRDSMAICGSVSTEVRVRFFNDDFNKYLAWANGKNRKTSPLVK